MTQEAHINALFAEIFDIIETEFLDYWNAGSTEPDDLTYLWEIL